MTDRVEQFRRPSLIRSAAANDDETEEMLEPDAAEYQAFRVGGRELRRISLLPVKGVWAHAAYRHHMDVFEDGGHGTGLVLDFPFMAAIITGRNLRPLIGAILRERCAFVQEFDPARWGAQPTDGRPVVTGLVLHIHTDTLPADAWAAVSRER